MTFTDPMSFEDNLAGYAARSSESRGRKYQGQPDHDSYRTMYQHDRDRIIYSTAFRRLQYKTQVYVVHEGDFYRTRLTHSIEVMQHARTLARALGANEDLVEAIAYAHDLGHPPFGHAGEKALDDLMGIQGFEHNLQSLRIVDELEMRYPEFPGLNLCFETREGLARHSTSFDDPRLNEEFSERIQPGIETQIVDVADELAYCTHDLDDALNAQLVTRRDLLDSGIDVILDAAEFAEKDVRRMKADGELRIQRMWTRRVVRYLIEVFSVDVIENTRRRCGKWGVTSVKDVTEMPERLVVLSPGMLESFRALKDWLMGNVYVHPRVLRQVTKGKMILTRLFEAFLEDPRLLHPATRERWDSVSDDDNAQRRVLCDHLAGMTDRYAMDLYQSLFVPYEKILHPGL